MNLFQSKKPIEEVSPSGIRRKRINALCEEMGLGVEIDGSMPPQHWIITIETIALAMLEAEAARRK